jgi:hypothetical protein
MKRLILWSALALGGSIAAWQAASALQSADNPTPPLPSPVKTATTTPKAQAALGNSKAETPMAQRVATIGLLNKRNGLWRDLTMKPGDAIRIGDVIVKLQACETTAPWEPEKLTGAFLQVITRAIDNKWYKNFSGWLYKESPSLNVVEHPIYDVWIKDCKMRHPDIGEDTIIARDSDAGPPSSGEDK